MTESRPPGPEDDSLEERYRRASEADASRPSEATRRAILAHARTVAAAQQPPGKPAIDTTRPAANDRYWWRSAVAGVAVAGIALMLWAPHLDRVGQGGDATLSSTADRAADAMQPAAQPAPADSSAPPAAAGDSLAEKAARRDAVAPEQALLARKAAPAYASPAPRPSPGVAQRELQLPEPASAAAPAPAAPSQTLRDVAVTAGRAESSGALALSAPATSALSRARDGAAPTRAPSVGAAAPPPHQGAKLEAPDGISLAPDEAKSPGALPRAIVAGDHLRVYVLLVNGAPLEAEDAAGDTPLLTAIRAGRLEVTQVLVGAGANVNVHDRSGKSALELARSLNEPDTAALLEQHGAR